MTKNSSPSLAALPDWAHARSICRSAGVPQTRSEPGSAVLTVSEAAALLRVSPKTVRRMIRRGELLSFHVGRLVRIRRDSLERLAGGT